jgi:hypothetical protein
LRIVKIAGGEDEESFFVFYLSMSLQSANVRLPELSFSQLPQAWVCPDFFLGRAGFRRRPGQAQACVSLVSYDSEASFPKQVTLENR